MLATPVAGPSREPKEYEKPNNSLCGRKVIKESEEGNFFPVFAELWRVCRTPEAPIGQDLILSQL